jgi:hypothetical protein
MSPSRDRVEPRTFFLNETHELSPLDKDGGGRLPQYTGISWAAKAKRIGASLRGVADGIKASHDPLKENRYFLLAQPVEELEKRSTDKKKAPEGTFKERTKFGGQHGRVFDRLGLDLLQVTEGGEAVIHADKDKFEQLLQRVVSLERLGPREQSRWATIDLFDTIPLSLRVDSDWLSVLKPNEPSEIVIELHPVLTRVEADTVLRAIADLLGQREGEKLTGVGTDFSGRFWFRGRGTQRSVRTIARDFFSVQAIHSPLYSIAAGKSKPGSAAPLAKLGATGQVNTDSLPCVAVVDLGVPLDHKWLKKFRRGQFIPQGAPNHPVGDHGSFVASRVVFGDCSTSDSLASTPGTCAFFDAMVADYRHGSGRNNRVDDKLVLEAIRGVRGASPDVRVFNLSFGDTRPLDDFAGVVRREKRLLLQDLDNFVFASDSVVVVAAGNSAPGLVPTPPYPDHHADRRWALGPWACGFNTLICGSFVSVLSANGHVKKVGWPSPFTRIGPGLCGAPVPSFGAEGGNVDDAFGCPPGLGVWGFSGSALPEDRVGTSFAAPLLAREAAIALQRLQDYCVPGNQPFAITARAFLTLTARPPSADSRVSELIERTLGYGKANVHRLLAPAAGSAVMLWQGLIESVNDIVRVQLPIPIDWLSHAETPMLRLVVCYDPPVNEIAQATWACRKVQAVLHLSPDTRGVRAPTGRHHSHPVIDRLYNLGKFKPGNEKAAEGDVWLLELSYDEVAPYPPGMDFDPRQRVAFAAEVFDVGERHIDPQAAMQALPIASTMNRLSIQPTPIRTPVILRART